MKGNHRARRRANLSAKRFDHVREGKHGVKSTKQAIAIGLSKARRAGVKLQAPREGTTSEKTRQQAVRDSRRAKSSRKPSRKRSAATEAALKKEGHSAASKKALSAQARGASSRRSASARHQSAMKAVRTKRKEGRMAASQKLTQQDAPPSSASLQVSMRESRRPNCLRSAFSAAVFGNRSRGEYSARFPSAHQLSRRPPVTMTYASIRVSPVESSV